MMRNHEIAAFNERCGTTLGVICETLMHEIDSVLTDSQPRIYYANPVWFTSGAPQVGYCVSARNVILRFWDGQLFVTPGLTQVGSFRAAEVKYRSINDVDGEFLRLWLEESRETHRRLRASMGVAESALY